MIPLITENNVLQDAPEAKSVARLLVNTQALICIQLPMIWYFPSREKLNQSSQIIGHSSLSFVKLFKRRQFNKQSIQLYQSCTTYFSKKDSLAVV